LFIDIPVGEEFRRLAELRHATAHDREPQSKGIAQPGLAFGEKPNGRDVTGLADERPRPSLGAVASA
jgi:hypothetical protein